MWAFLGQYLLAPSIPSQYVHNNDIGKEEVPELFGGSWWCMNEILGSVSGTTSYKVFG